MAGRVRRVALIGATGVSVFVVTGCAGTISSSPTIPSSPAVLTVPTTMVTTIVPPAMTVVVKVTETAPATAITVTTTVTAPSPSPAAAFRDGQHIVGRDILPGTYRASTDRDICYWERKDDSGGVIDNGFGTIVTIRSSDFTFQSNRCGTWSRVD